MSIRDIRQALNETDRAESAATANLADGEVQVIVKAGRAQVTITAGNNRVSVRTDKAVETEKVRVTGDNHVFHLEHDVLGSAVTVLSQINEA